MQVGALPLHQLFQPAVELRDGRIAGLHVAPHLVSSGYVGSARCPRPVPSSPIGRLRDELQLLPRSAVLRRRRRRGTRSPGPRAARTSAGAGDGREPSNIPSSRPRWTVHTSSRCSSSRSRKGQPRSAISTVPAAPASEAGVETGLCQCLSKTRQVRPGAACARRRRVPGDEVVTPFPGERVRPAPGARPGDQRGQDVGEEPVVTPVPVARGDGGVHGLGPADRGRTSPGLRGDEARVDEPPQMGTDRVGVQAQPGRQLADRDGTTGQAKVPVEAVPGVVRQCLVDLDRGGFVHLRISYDGLCTVRTVSTRA